MKLPNSLSILFVVAALLFSVGFACNDSDRASTSNTGQGNENSGSSTSSAQTPTAPKNIAGNYDATGTNVNGGGNYKASLLVTPRDDVHQFSWTSGTKSYYGVGVMADNAVAVAYTEGSNGTGCGVVLYRIGADGSLDGRSGYWGVNSAEKETAIRVSGTDLEGKYEVSGTNTDGKDYTGTLDIKKDGQGYAFKWNAGSTFEGFGIKTGDKVAVGFGGKQCAFVSYEVKPDGTLDGKWGGQGTRSFGTEVAKKK